VEDENSAGVGQEGAVVVQGQRRRWWPSTGCWPQAAGDRGALPAKLVVDVGRVDEGGAPRGAVVATGAADVPVVAVAGAPGFESSFEGSIVVVEVVEGRLIAGLADVGADGGAGLGSTGPVRGSRIHWTAGSSGHMQVQVFVSSTKQRCVVAVVVSGKSVRDFEEAGGVVARDVVARGGSNGEEDGKQHSRTGHAWANSS
jgi:hypothetical protein